MTLEDGLTADSLSAAAGEDYTFRATDPLHYDYKPSAKVGGKDVTVKDNGDGTYSDENGFRYTYQGNGSWADGSGNSYQTWNDKDYAFGIQLDSHELQGSNGTTSVKSTTNGDYYYRDENGVGYTDNGDGTWTDENGNSYTE